MKFDKEIWSCKRALHNIVSNIVLYFLKILGGFPSFRCKYCFSCPSLLYLVLKYFLISITSQGVKTRSFSCCLPSFVLGQWTTRCGSVRAVLTLCCLSWCELYSKYLSVLDVNDERPVVSSYYCV